MGDRYRGVCECGDHAWAVATRGYVVLTSPCDGDLLQGCCWTAGVVSQGRNRPYVKAKRGPGHLDLHREILQPPPEVTVDHVNGWPMDNRRPNLRECSHAENTRNARPCGGRYRKLSKFKGVQVDIKRGRFNARITVEGAHHFVGAFDDEVSAAIAYDEAAHRFHGEFALTNRSLGLL